MLAAQLQFATRADKIDYADYMKDLGVQHSHDIAIEPQQLGLLDVQVRFFFEFPLQCGERSLSKLHPTFRKLPFATLYLVQCAAFD